MKCYTYKKIISNYGLYDDSIDSTYIIHLENNGRLDNVMKQINKYMPTKIVYIVFNKGYKNCNKDNYINTPPLDLVNAFLEIFDLKFSTESLANYMNSSRFSMRS
jgi:hypothetical protein